MASVDDVVAAGAAVGTNSGTLGFRAPSAATTAEAVTAVLPSFLLLLTATETVGMPVVTAAVDEAAAVKLAAALAMGRDSAVTGHLSGSIFGRNCGERENGEM